MGRGPCQYDGITRSSYLRGHELVSPVRCTWQSASAAYVLIASKVFGSHTFQDRATSAMTGNSSGSLVLMSTR